MIKDEVNARKRIKRYQVDLSSYMACCESNYARLLRLMPERTDKTHWRYHLQQGDHDIDLDLSVIEDTPYTSLVEVRRSDKQHDWDSSPRLHVRLYHDAQMAEVIFWWDNQTRHKASQPRYEYPNSQAYQRDERIQFNKFLHDWLIHSQENGRSPITLEAMQSVR